MSLSVCLLAGDPAGRIATILEPLRPHAEEILIAADSRVDERTLAGYASLADRLVKIEFAMVERHLGWLYEQCKGEWILRLDGDEVPSEAFVRRLPELLARRGVRQFWASVQWLYPDPSRALDEAPWSSDFPVRLMRNDGTIRVPGDMHAHVSRVGPREYVEEPFYHLGLLANDLWTRRDKAVAYEAAQPHLTAPGGGRINDVFYLPERRAQLPQLRAVPAEDAARIERALNAKEMPPAGEVGGIETVRLAETDELWAGRSVAPSAYRATIEPWEQAVTLLAGEQRELFFRVDNDGSERWPDSLDQEPAIRLSYRWLDDEGGIRAEGPRTAFPRPVDPGERVLAPLHVDAPERAGDYLLEVDVVHEQVRWFDCGCKVAVQVREQAPTDDRTRSLKETVPPRLKRWRRLRIPRTIHRVWLGEEPMPAEQRRFGERFAELHPGWTTRLWTDADLAELGISQADRARSRSASELSNLVRYELLARLGGVYVDTDVEPLRDLTPLLRGVEAFAALELPGRVGTAVLGSVAGHPAFVRAAAIARRTLGLGAHSADANGPYMLSLVLEDEPGVTIFGAELFYPYGWDEAPAAASSYPDAYAIHRWAKSWWSQEQTP
jgi:inositol phosphorylceramide mannosyltransferase catalytic subunit